MNQAAGPWPNFFIVGAPKAGTTSLYAYLAQHPDVFMPQLKEPHYFSQVRPCPELRHVIDCVTDTDRYLALYRRAPGFRAVGDGSPSYLWDSEAPRRIAKVAPDARIIIMLRDPVERAFSHYLMEHREGVVDLPFYEALIRDYSQREKGWGVSQLFVELGQYHDQVARYFSTFGRDQVLVLLLDDLIKDARGTMERVAVHLGIDTAPLAAIDVGKVHNGYRDARGPWARRLANSAAARRLGQWLLPPAVQWFIYENFILKRASKPVADERASRFLQSIYDEEIGELEALLGRSLPELRRTWGSAGVRSEPRGAGRRAAAA